MRIVDNTLNTQAEAIMAAQTMIKLIIKHGVLHGYSKTNIFREIEKVIRNAMYEIRSPTLKKDAKQGLTRFAIISYRKFIEELGEIKGILLLAIIALMNTDIKKEKEEYERVIRTLSYQNATSLIFDYSDIFGSSQKYFEKIKNACKNLAEAYALDPNDFTGRNSLRNLAEMQVRYERHLSEIADLKARGIHIVVCSVHADCSERCRPWQGRIYSLDGTSGITEDGKPYIPLERATDIYYTTKAGRIYKNGLLGFNCRHKLYVYKPGMQIPTVSHKEQKKQYAIDKRQRELEREVLRLREDALMQRGIDKKAYTRLAEHAHEKNREYIVFSRKNGRKYFPDRTKLLFKPSRNDQ